MSSENKHTQGFLQVRRETAIDYRPNLIYGNEGGSLVAVLQGGGPRRAITGAEEDANALRLVACWNACDGLDTFYLESIVSMGLQKANDRNIATLRERIEQLEKALRFYKKGYHFKVLDGKTMLVDNGGVAQTAIDDGMPELDEAIAEAMHDHKD